MNELARLYVQNQNSERTQYVYTWALRKWFEWLSDREPTMRLALDYRKHLEDTLHSRSAALAYNTCRAFYRFVGGDNVFANLKSPARLVNSVPKVPEDSVVNRMMSLCDDLRDRAILALLLNGLREREVTLLRTSDWQYSEEYGRYIVHVLGKGNKERRVIATKEAVRAVSEYRSSLSGDPEWLVLSRDGSKLTTRRVSYVCEKWSKAAGKLFRPHALRHHYATRLVRAKTNVFVVQNQLGHSNIRATQVYVSLDLDDIIKETSKDPRNKKGKNA
jgi:site-specific recombinase XerC